jgi:hypothetical protein
MSTVLSSPHIPMPVPIPPTSMPPDIPAPTAPRHHMITCARDGIRQPNPRYATTAVTMPPLVLSSVHTGHRDLDWHRAMEDEYQALQDNQTWTLVPRPASAWCQCDLRQVVFQKQAQSRRHTRAPQGVLGRAQFQAMPGDRLRPDFLPCH